MDNLMIREMTVKDASDVIALNKTVESTTSPMDEDQFYLLFELSDFKKVVQVNGDVVAFVIGIIHGRGYKNRNYEWFSHQLNQFLYIDRIVVSESCRGMGIGRSLYSLSDEWAVQLKLSTICAEIDLDPPNHKSLRFHENTGFVQIGTRLLNGGKRVSMQILNLGSMSQKMQGSK